MQYFVIFFAIFSLVALVHGQNDPKCKKDPFAVGKCQQIITGYTFTPEKNRCSSYSAEGCRVTGNFFKTRQQCEKKCGTDFLRNDFPLQNYGNPEEFQRNLMYLHLLREFANE
ncbi:U-actitoxin-Avd3r [Drosophila yakuba]|uniref:BPTI/Kunitz inhibitor domain-containing protein n=1 Tax=Drosophila yakuba TaxID=7245 RepID=A0A0R1DNH8_DROYA|nr:U-actitoxin-Avd3r [Drosophila yakuba]KRJ97218.1 uncharacterized protein Dyak_GE28108 [Drosophila yakuba]